MAIFNNYVKLPEGNDDEPMDGMGDSYSITM